MVISAHSAYAVGPVAGVKALARAGIPRRSKQFALRLETDGWAVAPIELIGTPEFGAEFRVAVGDKIADEPLVFVVRSLERVSPPLPPLDAERKPVLVDASSVARQGEVRDADGRPVAWRHGGGALLFGACAAADRAGWEPIILADGNLREVFSRAGDLASVRALDHVRWTGLASRGEASRWAYREVGFTAPGIGAPPGAGLRDVADRAILRAAISEFPSAPIVTRDCFRGLAENEPEFRWTQDGEGRERMAPISVLGNFFTVPRLGLEGVVARELFK